MNKINKFSDAIITLCSVMLAFIMYNNILINADVAWHVEGARRILAGGDYLTNLLDNNSPYVFIFYIPVIWLSKIKVISCNYLINLYLLLWILATLALCHYLLSRIYLRDNLTKRVVYFTLIFILCFLPQASFGQREIVLVMLFLPYLFVRLHALLAPGTSLNFIIVILSVLFAILAISQNYFYLVLPLFLDSYITIKRKCVSNSCWFFYLGISISILNIAIAYPDYFQYIVPMTLCYEAGFNFPITLLLFEILVVISVLTILLIISHYKNIGDKNDVTALSGLIFLSLLIYFFEMKVWYYHLYPALAFTLLLLSLIAAKCSQDKFFHNGHQHNEIILVTSLAMLFTMTFTVATYIKDSIINFHNPKEETKLWIQYVQQHFDHKKLFFFVIRLGPAYISSIYTNVTIVSPWSNPWFLPNMIKNYSTGQFCNPVRDLNIFFTLTAKALKGTAPDFIIIEDVDKSVTYLGSPFSYRHFFSQDKQIQSLLKNYLLFDHYLGFDIYQKKKTF
jgi:hypothetical protein